MGQRASEGGQTLNMKTLMMRKGGLTDRQGDIRGQDRET